MLRTGPVAAASAASLPEPALDLALRPGWRSGATPPAAAADERRIHAARPTAEQRMTEALGNRSERSEEVLADGTRRLRDGGRCYLVHPSRTATLFPFEPSAQRAPKTVESCD